MRKCSASNLFELCLYTSTGIDRDLMCVHRDVASEQFAENTTVLSYLQTRLVALNRAELNSLQEAITKRISELLLFTLYVECDGCADIDGLGPMPVQII